MASVTSIHTGVETSVWTQAGARATEQPLVNLPAFLLLAVSGKR